MIGIDDKTIIRRWCKECFKAPIGLSDSGEHFIFEECKNIEFHDANDTPASQ